MRKWIIIAAGVLVTGTVIAQTVPGRFPAGTIYGNPTGSSAPPITAAPSAFGLQLASITTPVVITAPTPIAGSGTYTSACQTATGNDRVDFGATLSVAGTLKINRYLGTACATAVAGNPVSRAASAATATVVSASDGAAFQSFTVQIDNTSGTTSTVTGFIVLRTSSSVITGNPIYTDLFGNQTQPVVPLCGGAPCTAANPQFTTFAAGELHVGETGTNQTAVIGNLAGLTAVSYVSGNSLGGLVTLAGMARTSAAVGQPGTSGQILSTLVTFTNAVGSGPVDIYYFDNNPTASTCTNNTAFTLADADRNKVIGIAHVTDFNASPVITIGQLGGFPMPYSINAGTSVFACVVSRGTVAISAGGGASINVRVARQ